MSRTTQWVFGSFAMLAFLYVMWGPQPTTTRDADGLRWEVQRYGVFGYLSEEICISFQRAGVPHPAPRSVSSRDALISTVIVTLAIPALFAVFIRYTTISFEAS